MSLFFTNLRIGPKTTEENAVFANSSATVKKTGTVTTSTFKILGYYFPLNFVKNTVKAPFRWMTRLLLSEIRHKLPASFEGLNYGDKILWTAFFDEEIQELTTQLRKGTIFSTDLRNELQRLRSFMARFMVSPAVYLDRIETLIKNLQEPCFVRNEHLGILSKYLDQLHAYLKKDTEFTLDCYVGEHDKRACHQWYLQYPTHEQLQACCSSLKEGSYKAPIVRRLFEENLRDFLREIKAGRFSVKQFSDKLDEQLSFVGEFKLSPMEYTQVLLKAAEFLRKKREPVFRFYVEVIGFHLNDFFSYLKQDPTFTLDCYAYDAASEKSDEWYAPYLDALTMEKCLDDLKAGAYKRPVSKTLEVHPRNQNSRLVGMLERTMKIVNYCVSPPSQIMGFVFLLNVSIAAAQPGSRAFSSNRANGFKRDIQISGNEFLLTQSGTAIGGCGTSASNGLTTAVCIILENATLSSLQLYSFNDADSLIPQRTITAPTGVNPTGLECEQGYDSCLFLGAYTSVFSTVIHTGSTQLDPLPFSPGTYASNSKTALLEGRESITVYDTDGMDAKPLLQAQANGAPPDRVAYYSSGSLLIAGGPFESCRGPAITPLYPLAKDVLTAYQYKTDSMAYWGIRLARLRLTSSEIVVVGGISTFNNDSIGDQYGINARFLPYPDQYFLSWQWWNGPDGTGHYLERRLNDISLWGPTKIVDGTAPAQNGVPPQHGVLHCTVKTCSYAWDNGEDIFALPIYHTDQVTAIGAVSQVNDPSVANNYFPEITPRRNGLEEYSITFNRGGIGHFARNIQVIPPPPTIQEAWIKYGPSLEQNPNHANRKTYPNFFIQTQDAFFGPEQVTLDFLEHVNLQFLDSSSSSVTMFTQAAFDAQLITYKSLGPNAYFTVRACSPFSCSEPVVSSALFPLHNFDRLFRRIQTANPTPIFERSIRAVPATYGTFVAINVTQSDVELFIGTDEFWIRSPNVTLLNQAFVESEVYYFYDRSNETQNEIRFGYDEVSNPSDKHLVLKRV